MKLITRVEIEGFRSIKSASLALGSEFTALAGLNNSGKSNVLRALNAFFNDETDPGQRLDVDTDYYRSDKSRRRKRILVAVHFTLPSSFRFRKGLEPTRDLLGGKSFSLAKEWLRDRPQPALLLNGAELEAADTQQAAKLLQLVKFRYVPNRVLPVELIRNEHQGLRDVLVRRLAKHGKGNPEAFAAIRSTSARMIESLTKRFREACPGQGEVSLATPASWTDLAFAFGYRLDRNGIELRDTEQGSGIQSLLMLETLLLIDRDYFQQFGWRQAAVWGIEEPESSLHSSLEARVASYLADVATEPKGRLQVIATTHSDLVVQYAGSTVLVSQQEAQTVLEHINDRRAALERISGAGVARWVHPILEWPLDPIVLVEGKLDREFIAEALRFRKLGRPLRLVDLGMIEGREDAGGLDSIKRYVKDNASAIRKRADYAPLVVVLDWDAANRRDAFANLLPNCGAYKVLAWPEGDANPRANKSFKGIERFHCDRVLQLALDRDAPIAEITKGKYKGQFRVTPDDYNTVKKTLGELVRAGLTVQDFSHASSFIDEVLNATGTA